MKLNEILREFFDEKIELKVLSSGNVVVFDYEVISSAISDSILRALYYLLAIRSSLNYIKLYGLEKRFILMFEEPEAHIFPYCLDLLIDYIDRAKELMYIVIATHNPLLISILWDRIKNLKTYYVVRDKYGATRVYEVDIEKMAKDLVTSTDLLLMPPREVISKYALTQKETSH